MKTIYALAAFPFAVASGAFASEGTTVLDSSVGYVAPIVVKEESPVYPLSLRTSGYEGDVVVEYEVDKNGNVTWPRVVKSAHPEFEASAIEALLNWKFKPGTKDGLPVSVRIRHTFRFYTKTHAFGSIRGGDVWSILGPIPDGQIWSIPSRSSKKVPEQFQYDQPPKPIVTISPVYPFDLLQHNVSGKASVAFAIDLDGRPHVVKVFDASHPDFGAAAKAMIATWTFEPATKKGNPCWALIQKEQVFNGLGADIPTNDSAARLLRDIGKSPCPIIRNASELDAKIQGRFLPGPIVPDDLRISGKHEQAEIEFIVDHSGHAQLPRILSSTSPDFGWAAATAVGRWQFSVPTRGGKPVDVFVRVPLDYSPPVSVQSKS